MTIVNIVFSPEAQEQLVLLYRYIANASSPKIAGDYTEAIVSYCESLVTFSHRGVQRSDVRPGLRVTHYKKRTAIAFIVNPDEVVIVGIFYRGQNFEVILHEPDSDDGGH